MNRRTAILTAALACLCAASQLAPTVRPKQVAEFAKRAPGKPQRCVTVEPGLLFRVSDADPQLLLYDDGKTIWASVLAPGCGFQAGQSVVPDESASYYKRAAKAAGVSPNAVYARRMKHPLFRAKWEAVLETGRAAIEMKLVEAANKSFDPDEIDTGEVEPRVSVAEAIRIVQAHGSKTQRAPYVPTLEEEAQQMRADELDAVRERLITKLGRLHERRISERLEQGWSLDESHDLVVPPGWVKIDPAD